MTQTEPKPSPRGQPLPDRYKLDDERPGITRKVEIYTAPQRMAISNAIDQYRFLKGDTGIIS